MGMSAFYGSTDEDEAILTIRRALELGITFIDTAQLYGPLTNELLVGRAVKGHRDEYVIATKFNRRMDEAVPGEMSTVGKQDGVRAGPAHRVLREHGPGTGRPAGRHDIRRARPEVSLLPLPMPLAWKKPVALHRCAEPAQLSASKYGVTG